MKAENYKKPIIIRKIRDNVWQKFRVICAAQDISANKNVIKLITEYVEKSVLDVQINSSYDLDEKLAKQFGDLCITRGVDVHDGINKLIRSYIEKMEEKS